ncbi:hypothetical protein QTP88_015962 [Uroleucon formosanum]
MCTCTSSGPLIHPDDPSNVFTSFRLELKERVIRGPYQPDIKLFPRTKIGQNYRSFQKKWYDCFKWLEYSVSKDKAFCFPCRMFLNSGSNVGQADTTFSKTGFSNWHVATTSFKTHQMSKSHIRSTSSMTFFLNSQSIDIALNKSQELELSRREMQRLANRNIMHRLVDISLCLAKNGKPFRGHNEKIDSVSKGLFLEMINILKKYDSVLNDHLQNCPKNASYLSNHIQNDIITSIHNVLKRNIAAKLSNRTVSIIADETTDCGHYEQLSICVRYFDENENRPQELFIGLKKMSSVNAQSIFDALTDATNQVGIDWQSVIAVCFDGAATMSGHYNGVQAKAKLSNPNILYVHCYGHCLNLILVDSLGKKNYVIFNFFGIIQMLYSFVEGSPIRHAILERVSKEMNIKLKSLKTLSTTRWACRAEAIQAVKNNYSVLLQCLAEISKTSNLSEIKVKSSGLIKQMKTFNFIFSLNMLNPILLLVQKVSSTLQSSDLDLLTAVSMVQSLKSSLKNLRTDDDSFKDVYEETIKICKENKIIIPEVKKRKLSAKIDQNSSNFTAENKMDEMKWFVFYPTLDEMLSGIERRFSQETLNLINATGNLIQLKLDSNDISMLKEKFNLDTTFESEIKLIKNMSDTTSIRGSSIKTIVAWLNWLSENDRKTTFRNFNKALTQFATIPVTSCSCERAFSKLSIVKSKLRNTMSQERLDSLMLIFIEQKMASEINIEEVIDEFKTCVPIKRRLEL